MSPNLSVSDLFQPLPEYGDQKHMTYFKIQAKKVLFQFLKEIPGDFSPIPPFHTPCTYPPLGKYLPHCSWVSGCLPSPDTEHKDMSPLCISPQCLLYDSHHTYYMFNPCDPRQPDTKVCHSLAITPTAFQRTEEKNTWNTWVNEHSHPMPFSPPQSPFPFIFDTSRVSSGRHFLIISLTSDHVSPQCLS